MKKKVIKRPSTKKNFQVTKLYRFLQRLFNKINHKAKLTIGINKY